MLYNIKKQGILRTLFSLMIFSLLFFTLSFISVNDNKVDPTSSHAEIQSMPVIVIDAGHGGEDGGAVASSGIVEKDINLKIAENVDSFCHLSGIESLMTRSDDHMLIPKFGGSSNRKRGDLIARTEIASRFENVIFVSIHQNKFENSRYKGLQVFFGKNNPFSSVLADTIKNTNKELIDPFNKRETKPGGSEIYVLDNINSPAVLIECGFLSNMEEADKLNTAKYQKELAFMIYTSLMRFIYDSEVSYNTVTERIINEE